MITPKYSFEPRERAAFEGKRAYFNPSFFRGEWKRSWPKVLCYTLFLFFVLPLPILFEINSRRSWNAHSLTDSLARLFGSNVWLYSFAAFAVAVFAGILATRYLCRRVSADFYHSLPIRREGLLIQNWLMGVLHFLTALAINLALSFVILMTVMDMLTSFSLPLGKLGQAAGYMLVVFLLFYTLTVFCGMLCGTSSMQVMLTGLILGAFPLFRVLALTFGEMFTSTIDLNYFWDQSWKWTSPFIRLFYLIDTETLYYMDERTDVVLENPLTWLEIVVWLAAAVVLFFGAMLLYRRRRVERAGTPVVFDGVAAAVKWVVIVLGTMALGWLFMELGSNSVFWMFFGFVLGGFLSFLLINTILTKNPKQMFDGWKRLLIYLVAFCVVFVGWGFALSAVEDIVPKNVKRIAIFFDGDNYSVPYYTDPDVIGEWKKLWEKDPNDNVYSEMLSEYYAGQDEKAEASDDTTESEDKTHYFVARKIGISAYVKFGPFVIPYDTRLYVREDAEGLIRAVTESEEFEAGWDEMMGAYSRTIFESNNPVEIGPAWSGPFSYFEFWGLFDNFYNGQYGERRQILGKVAYTKREHMNRVIEQTVQDINFDYFQSPAYATLYATSLERTVVERMSDGLIHDYSFSYCLTMNTPSLIDDLLSMDVETFYGVLADYILKYYGGVYVAKHLAYTVTASSEGVILVTDRELIIEILKGIAKLASDGGSMGIPAFTILEEDYAVFFPNTSTDQVINFIKGKVPAFVTEALG